jgi:lipoprotein-releasing system ATP-binding protein
MSKSILTLQDIHRSFPMAGSMVDVLKGVSLAIPEGSTTALVGASGAGKSTLLYVMGGLDRPTSGSVVVDGTPIQSLGERDLALFRNKTIGFVFQFHHLLPEFSALENIMMPALLRFSNFLRRSAYSPPMFS